MTNEKETARLMSASELPPDLTRHSWVDITQTYLSPFPPDSNFPEISHGELRLRHTVNHLGQKACVATAKFGDKRSGERLEIETELTKGDFVAHDSKLAEGFARGMIKKRRYILDDNRVIDKLDPALHGDVMIEEQEYPGLESAPLNGQIIPVNRELAVPIASTAPQLAQSSREDLLATIERRHRRNGKLLISISGMSGSGKTTFAERLADDTGATLIKADDFHIGSRNMRYYGLDPENHDNPRVYDYFAAGEAAYRVMEGHGVSIPHYDFASAERSDERKYIAGNDKGLVIVDGLYAKRAAGFAALQGNAFNMLVDRPLYACVLRRLLRDSAPELTGTGDGRQGIFTTPEGSLKYIMETAMPTYLRHQIPLQSFDAIA